MEPGKQDKTPASDEPESEQGQSALEKVETPGEEQQVEYRRKYIELIRRMH